MDFSIILPSYNEAANLSSLLKNLKESLDKLAIRYEIIVVDNGSSDNTQAVLTSLKKEIPELKNARVWPNIGYGNGVIRGLGVAQGEILGFMDADGQIEPKYLIAAFLKLKKGGLDLCKGIRTIRHDGLFRLLASRAYNLLFKIMFGGTLGDVNTKPKVFTKDLYQKINLSSKDWFLDSEIILKTIKRGYKIGEVPMVFLPRNRGVSKVRVSTIFEFLKNIFYWRFFAKF